MTTYDPTAEYTAAQVPTWIWKIISPHAVELQGTCPQCNHPVGVTVPRQALSYAVPPAWTKEDLPDEARCQCNHAHDGQLKVGDFPPGCGARFLGLQTLRLV